MDSWVVVLGVFQITVFFFRQCLLVWLIQGKNCVLFITVWSKKDFLWLTVRAMSFFLGKLTVKET